MNRFITTQRDNVEIRKVGWELRRREEGRKDMEEIVCFTRLLYTVANLCHAKETGEILLASVGPVMNSGWRTRK